MILTNFIKILEFSILFFVLPILFLYEFIPLKMIIPVLWLVSIYVFIIMKYNKQVIIFDKLDFDEFKKVLLRFSIIAIALLVYTFYFHNNRLFSFIFENPELYAMVLIIYPLLSVIPQELIYRKFFKFRYKSYFSFSAFFFVNALVFSFAHIIFFNYIAVIFTFVGALLFLDTYMKTKSFTLVCVEHALYGNLLFTIGLGDFFYHRGVV